MGNSNGISEMPIMTAEQREAYEFNKMASHKEMKTRDAHTIMSALAIGGDNVKPLFKDAERIKLEDKLFKLLNEL